MTLSLLRARMLLPVKMAGKQCRYRGIFLYKIATFATRLDARGGVKTR
jgi:hypothetical protein